MAVLVFILFGSVNGYSTFFWRRSEERKHIAADAKTLLDFPIPIPELSYDQVSSQSNLSLPEIDDGDEFQLNPSTA